PSEGPPNQATDLSSRSNSVERAAKLPGSYPFVLEPRKLKQRSTVLRHRLEQIATPERSYSFQYLCDPRSVRPDKRCRTVSRHLGDRASVTRQLRRGHACTTRGLYRDHSSGGRHCRELAKSDTFSNLR